jgi:hypothetical protein
MSWRKLPALWTVSSTVKIQAYAHSRPMHTSTNQHSAAHTGRGGLEEDDANLN